MVVSNSFYFHLGGRFQFWLIFLKWVVQPPTSMETFFKMMLPPTTGWFHPPDLRVKSSQPAPLSRWFSGGICDRFLEGKHIIFSDFFLGQLVVDWLVVWGPVVWIPRISLWKGLLLMGTPLIPNHGLSNRSFESFPTSRTAAAWIRPVLAGKYHMRTVALWRRCGTVGSWGNKIWIDCWF